MGILKLIFFAVVSIVLMIFCTENRSFVVVSFFPSPYVIELPLFVFALICVTVGVVFGGFSACCKMQKIKRELRKKNQREQALENEIKSLRMERENKLPIISKT